MTRPPQYPGPDDHAPRPSGAPPPHPFLSGPPPAAAWRPGPPDHSPPDPHRHGPPPSIEEAPTVVLGPPPPPPRSGPPAFPPPPPGTGWPTRIQPTPPRPPGRGLPVAVIAIAVAAVAAVTAAVVGVGGPAVATFAEPDRDYSPATLRVVGHEPENLLPADTYAGSRGLAASALYEGLTTIDADTGVPLPAIAESWETSDQQSWTFRLKEGLTFHNGEPITARSFVEAWSFAVNPANEQTMAYVFEHFEVGAGGTLDGVTAIDDRTLEIRLKEPWSPLPAAVATLPFAPMPKECTVTADACATTAIGSGPFRQEGPWTPGEPLRLVAWNDHRDGRPQYAGVEFTFASEPERAAMMIEAGDADLYLTDDPAAAEANPTLPTAQLTSLTLPDSKPYDKPAIREAIAAAVDTARIAETLGGGTEAAPGFVPSTLPGAAPCGGCGFDPEAAKARFKDGKWPKKKDIEIGHLRSPMSETVAETLCGQLSDALGVDCETVALDADAYFEKAADPDHPMLVSWMPDYPSAEGFLTSLYADFLGVDDAEFLEALDQGVSADATTATGFYATAQERLASVLPTVPLFSLRTQTRLGDAVVPESLVVDPATQTVRLSAVELR